MSNSDTISFTATIELTFDGHWQRNKDARCVVTWKNKENEYIEGFPEGRDRFIVEVPARIPLVVRAICAGLRPTEIELEELYPGEERNVHVTGVPEGIIPGYYPSYYPR